jgi:hypothetical protein
MAAAQSEEKKTGCTTRAQNKAACTTIQEAAHSLRDL